MLINLNKLQRDVSKSWPYVVVVLSVVHAKCIKEIVFVFTSVANTDLC